MAKKSKSTKKVSKKIVKKKVKIHKKTKGHKKTKSQKKVKNRKKAPAKTTGGIDAFLVVEEEVGDDKALFAPGIEEHESEIESLDDLATDDDDDEEEEEDTEYNSY